MFKREGLNSATHTGVILYQQQLNTSINGCSLKKSAAAIQQIYKALNCGQHGHLISKLSDFKNTQLNPHPQIIFTSTTPPPPLKTGLAPPRIFSDNFISLRSLYLTTVSSDYR